MQPYWLRHIVIALAIMAVTGWIFGAGIGALIAAGFYLGHELRDLFVRHKHGDRFDWPGLLAPWCAVALAYTAWRITPWT